MGCFPSKPPETAALSLCRRRRHLILQTIDRRFSLAAAHAAYFRSLAALRDALQHFARSLHPPPPPARDSHLQISSSSSSDSDTQFKPSPNPNPKANCSYMRTSGSRANVVYADAGDYAHDLNYYYGRSVGPDPAEGVSSSGWDFLDPFCSYEGFLPGCGSEGGSSPDSSEVRLREGIPDLEDENGGVVKKVVEDCSGVKVVEAKGTAEESEKRAGKVEEAEKEGGEVGSCSGKGFGLEEKGGVFEEGTGGLAGEEGRRDVLEALGSVGGEFGVAVVGSEEVSRLLEVGRRSFGESNRVFRGWFFVFYLYSLFGLCNEHDVVREIDGFM